MTYGTRYMLKCLAVLIVVWIFSILVPHAIGWGYYLYNNSQQNLWLYEKALLGASIIAFVISTGVVILVSLIVYFDLD